MAAEVLQPHGVPGRDARYSSADTSGDFTRVKHKPTLFFRPDSECVRTQGSV